MGQTKNSKKAFGSIGNTLSNMKIMSHTKELSSELNELKVSIEEISNKLGDVNIKELKASVDEISNKLSDLDNNIFNKILQKIHGMDEFSKRLGNVEHGLVEWNKNYDDLLVKIIEFEGMNKELSSPNSHSSFPLPKHSSNLGSLNGFTHKLKIDVSRFDG